MRKQASINNLTVKIRAAREVYKPRINAKLLISIKQLPHGYLFIN